MWGLNVLYKTSRKSSAFVILLRTYIFHILWGIEAAWLLYTFYKQTFHNQIKSIAVSDPYYFSLLLISFYPGLYLKTKPDNIERQICCMSDSLHIWSGECLICVNFLCWSIRSFSPSMYDFIIIVIKNYNW